MKNPLLMVPKDVDVVSIGTLYPSLERFYGYKSVDFHW